MNSECRACSRRYQRGWWPSIGRLTPQFGFFFFNDTATTEIYTLSLHDALPICMAGWRSEASSRLRKLPSACGRMADRKSTRLNSSHLVISYAVFCLKKKKDINDDFSPEYECPGRCTELDAC